MTEQEMLRKMAAYCSSAERCIQDVEKKLLGAGFSKEVSKRIISRLLQEKFIDEKRFSIAFVNDKLRFNQWGRIRISYELKKKGISPICLEESLSTIDEQEYENILISLLQAKQQFLNAKDERDRFYKLLRFAVGRGFSVQETIRCLKSLLTNVENYTENME